MSTEIQPAASFLENAQPVSYIRQATLIANNLGPLIRERSLWSNIQGRAYVHVEGWTLLANLVGVFPDIEWTRRLQGPESDAEGWEARCVVRNSGGLVIGSGESMCTRAETNCHSPRARCMEREGGKPGCCWKTRDDNGLRAMAQTRAISRALRNPLGFIVKLAGYDVTPAEEMGVEGSPDSGDSRG